MSHRSFSLTSGCFSYMYCRHSPEQGEEEGELPIEGPADSTGGGTAAARQQSWSSQPLPPQQPGPPLPRTHSTPNPFCNHVGPERVLGRARSHTWYSSAEAAEAGRGIRMASNPDTPRSSSSGGYRHLREGTEPGSSRMVRDSDSGHLCRGGEGDANSWEYREEDRRMSLAGGAFSSARRSRDFRDADAGGGSYRGDLGSPPGYQEPFSKDLGTPGLAAVREGGLPAHPQPPPPNRAGKPPPIGSPDPSDPAAGLLSYPPPTFGSKPVTLPVAVGGSSSSNLLLDLDGRYPSSRGSTLPGGSSDPLATPSSLLSPTLPAIGAFSKLASGGFGPSTFGEGDQPKRRRCV